MSLTLTMEIQLKLNDHDFSNTTPAAHLSAALGPTSLLTVQYCIRPNKKAGPCYSWH